MAPVNITGLHGTSNLCENSSGLLITPEASKGAGAAGVDDLMSRGSGVGPEATITRGMEDEVLGGTKPDTSMWLRIHLQYIVVDPTFITPQGSPLCIPQLSNSETHPNPHLRYRKSLTRP